MEEFNIEERAKKIEHEGKTIVFMDYSNLPVEQASLLADVSPKIIQKEPLNSVLFLIDVTEARYNPEIIEKLKRATKGNNPYVKKTAVVGVVGMKKILFNAIVLFSKRDIKLFDTVEEAKNYLVLD